MNLTVGGVLEATARRFPAQDALVYPSRGLRLSYLEFDARCDRVARGLLALGIKPGEHVAIWATNVPEWVLLQFATAKIGAVLVTINTNYKRTELEYVLRQSDATTLFLIDRFRDTDYVETLYEIAPELRSSMPGRLDSAALPALQRVVFLGRQSPDGLLAFHQVEALAEQVTAAQLAEVKAHLHPDEVVNMQYTSGTTGFPKGVMLTHNNLVTNAHNIASCMGFSERDRLCIPVPFFHCFGCVLGTMACVTHGAAMIPVEKFDPEQVLQVIQQERCTAVHGVPTMFIAELEHQDFDLYDLSSLRTGIMAGSPCPVEVMRRVIRDMHCREITIAYGQTESSPVITQTRTDDAIERRVATVGRALAGVEVKIVDPASGAELPAGQQGELCTRGYLVMKGYYKMPEATAQAIDADGWLHTGDLAVMDEHGYCRITGRIKDMIIRGGENIYPREVEEYLYTHPKVADVQVFGVPDRKFGEQVMAAIRLAEGVTCNDEEIKEYCRGRIANFKIPHYVSFVAGYPMTASGKIQKFRLRELAIEELGLQSDANIETA
jgi:fatty-acyl-CoA synthase